MEFHTFWIGPCQGHVKCLLSLCTFENWIRLSKPFRFQTDQKLSVGYLVTWFGEYFETVLVVNGRHLMWILPLRYSCLFQTLTERMKICLVFPTEVLYHSWSLLIAGEIKCLFRADILVGLTPFNLRISICNLFVYFSFPLVNIRLKLTISTSRQRWMNLLRWGLKTFYTTYSPDMILRDLPLLMRLTYSSHYSSCSQPRCLSFDLFLGMSRIFWSWKQNNGSKHARKFCWHA